MGGGNFFVTMFRVGFDDNYPTGLCMIIKAGKLKTTTTCPSANIHLGSDEIMCLTRALNMDPAVQIVVLDTNINMDVLIEACRLARNLGKTTFLRYPDEKELRNRIEGRGRREEETHTKKGRQTDSLTDLQREEQLEDKER